MECCRGKLFLSLALATLLVACDGCPVDVDDKVIHEGRSATVMAVDSWGRMTQNCRVGLLYDDFSASNDYVYAWKLAPNEEQEDG